MCIFLVVFFADTNNLDVLPDGTLQITNIQRNNHGTYSCEGKIKGRPKSEFLNISVVVNGRAWASVQLRIQSVKRRLKVKDLTIVYNKWPVFVSLVPPTVLVHGEKSKVVAGPNQSVTLTCLVSGAPHPNITWETWVHYHQYIFYS